MPRARAAPRHRCCRRPEPWPSTSRPSPPIRPARRVDAAQRARVTRGTRIVVIVALLLLAVGAGRTIVSRMANARVLEANVAEGAVQYVKTTVVRTSEGGQTIALPGSLQGAQQAPLAARSAGYVKRWTKDIGSHVGKGELLAVIESPEIDQQLSQAEATRGQTAASLALAKSTVERWEALRKKDVVSQQELDERRSGLAQATANLAAADANVQRLRQLQGFTRVTAPFDGVITKRNVDVGDLIDSSGKTLFVLTQMDPLRVYVNVPQSYAQLVRPGQKVVVTQSELRGQSFAGEVARTSASIDPATRTMQVEIALPNKNGILLPGAYVQVELPIAGQRTVVVPTNVLLFRGEGTRVATVDAANRVHLKPVTLGRNLGEAIEVIDGIAAGDRLVVNPSDSLGEGDPVAVARERGRRRGERGTAGAGGEQGAAVTRARARSRAAARAGADRGGIHRRAIAAMLAGCVAGPDYVRPAVETPPAWKLEAPWREGTPDDAAPKGPWWQRFGDARLDALQAEALAQSPTLALANARLAQARAVVAATSAGQWPSVNLNARALRQRISANRPLSNYASPNFSTVQNDAIVALSVNYEFDLAGRVQRTVEGVQASADQAAADFENTRLLLGTDLATAYFNLRAIDIELDVLARSIALQRRSLDFVRTRHDLGAASGLDVAQQQALLDTTLTQLDVVRRQRGAVRARGRDADRNAGAVVLARCRHPRADAAGGTARRPFRRPRAPARCRFRGAGDGGRQRADRRRQGGVLPEHHDHPQPRLREPDAGEPVQRAERALGDRRAVHAAALLGRPARRQRRVRARQLRRHRRQLPPRRPDRDAGGRGRHHQPVRARERRPAGAHRGRGPRASSSSSRPRATRAARRPTSTSSPPSRRCSRPSGWRPSSRVSACSRRSS